MMLPVYYRSHRQLCLHIVALFVKLVDATAIANCPLCGLYLLTNSTASRIHPPTSSHRCMHGNNLDDMVGVSSNYPEQLARMTAASRKTGPIKSAKDQAGFKPVPAVQVVPAKRVCTTSGEWFHTRLTAVVAKTSYSQVFTPAIETASANRQTLANSKPASTTFASTSVQRPNASNFGASTSKTAFNSYRDGQSVSSNANAAASTSASTSTAKRPRMMATATHSVSGTDDSRSSASSTSFDTSRQGNALNDSGYLNTSKARSSASTPHIARILPDALRLDDNAASVSNIVHNSGYQDKAAVGTRSCCLHIMNNH